MSNILYKLLAIFIIIASLAFGWAWMDIRDFLDQPLNIQGEGAVMNVSPGTTLRQVANELKAKGWLKHPRYLMWLARLKGQSNRIKAGEYYIKAGTTAPDMLAMIVSGRVMQYSLTIIEGMSFKELLEAMRQQEAMTQTLKGLSYKDIMAKLGYPGLHPEGRFLPDTYFFTRGTTDADFLKRAYAAMDQALEQEWAQRDTKLPYKDAYQALIMASIVEKETGVAEERSKIAGVFVRRLVKGMKLQTDPTVIYGMGARYKGNIGTKDLLRDTVYNTYTRKGLPPTPIAMPGRDALHAAVHPAPGNALYFVARGDGSHHFSATYQEHQKAVRRYQLVPTAKPYTSRPPKKNQVGS